jgi:hypothetical protein
MGAEQVTPLVHRQVIGRARGAGRTPPKIIHSGTISVPMLGEQVGCAQHGRRRKQLANSRGASRPSRQK